MNKERTQFLIDNLQESLEVEVKNWLDGLKDNRSKAKLAKEIIALANNGGGQIFIGFDDAVEGHPEILPEEGELEAFSQDSVANVVARYVDPPCQCEVHYFSRTDSEQLHPVITVPGKHRSPVWAKRSDPDEQFLKTGTVYLRRPGGNSEPAQNQNDWEHLLDRLVKARQDNQLAAFREIMNPSEGIDVSARPALQDWKEESYQIWQSLLEKLPENSPFRFGRGHFAFAFSIEPFDVQGLKELSDAIEREIPKYSGWPPFTYLHVDQRRPQAHGDIIQAWLAKVDGDDWEHADFWRISKEGFGFLLRPMQEDRNSYLSGRTPKPVGPFFDWTLPIYRAAEFMKYVEALALRFGDANSQISLSLHYFGTDGRKLETHDWRYNVREGAVCATPEIESQINLVVAEIGTNLEERLHAWLAPIYEQFEFTELPKLLVDNVVKEAISARR